MSVCINSQLGSQRRRAGGPRRSISPSNLLAPNSSSESSSQNKQCVRFIIRHLFFKAEIITLLQRSTSTVSRDGGAAICLREPEMIQRHFQSAVKRWREVVR